MRGFIVLSLCATVLAAPQGYLYNQQQKENFVGLQNFNANSQAGTTTITQENHRLLQEAVNTGGSSSLAHNTQEFSTVPNFSILQHQQQQQQQTPLISNFGGQQQQQAPWISNFDGQQQQHNGFQQQQQQYQTPGSVTKDIYVHIAPEDIHNQRYQQRPLPPPPARKHYRIVFIKAPSQNVNNAALRTQQAPTEEKTIIYVLTKKPDPLVLQNTIQDLQPKQPSKPEVYFIKYKTQAEAQHAQRTIQAQYDKLGGKTTISDEGIAPVASVIGSLDNTQKYSTLNYSKGPGHSSSRSPAISPPSSSFPSSGIMNNGSKYLPPIIKL